MAVDKEQLLEDGKALMTTFCAWNSLPAPDVKVVDRDWSFSVCGYYRPHKGIVICVQRCAAIGTAGRQWSYPGYTVDRTPYGVVQHELGHHADVQRSSRRAAYFGDFSIAVRGQVGEKPITSYCPNDAEWFAEMFRVFVTNPDLLKAVRPRTHRELSACFKPVFSDSWRDRLRDAPARTISAAEKKVEEARAA